LTTITEFKQYLRAAGYAPATIDSYRKNLDQFNRFLAELGVTDLRKITHQTIIGYQQTVMAIAFSSLAQLGDGLSHLLLPGFIFGCFYGLYNSGFNDNRIDQVHNNQFFFVRHAFNLFKSYEKLQVVKLAAAIFGNIVEY
jgi:hypothetical protein